jgi:hypothetical protein
MVITPGLQQPCDGTTHGAEADQRNTALGLGNLPGAIDTRQSGNHIRRPPPHLQSTFRQISLRSCWFRDENSAKNEKPTSLSGGGSGFIFP